MKNSFVSLLIILFVSCNIAEKKNSSDFDQNKIEVVYGLSYNNATKKGSASATFNVKTKAFVTQLELTGKSSITYNGHSMLAKTLPIVGGIYYDIDFNNYRPDHVFVYTDNNGKVYTSKFNARAIAITDTLEYSADEEFVIHVNRGPELGENMWFYFSGDELESEHLDVQTEKENEIGFYNRSAGTIKIDNQFLDKFNKSKQVEIYFYMNKYFKNLEQTPGKLGSVEIRLEDKRILHLR